MFIKVAKVGMEVVDERTGIAYRIEATDAATNATVTKAEATEILAEDETREPKKVTINATKALTFRVTKWIDDVEKHAANIVNGILTIGGKEVVMGSIVAKQILKVFPGTVVFTAAGPEDRDLVYEYLPSRDKFSKLGEKEPDTRVIEDSDTRVVYAFSLTKEIEIEEDGQKVKKTVFDRAGIYVLTKGRFIFTNLMPKDEEYDDEYDEDEYDETETGSADVSDNNFLGFDLTRVVIAQGDKYFYLPMVDDDKEITYVVYRITNVARYADTVKMPGFLTNVVGNHTGAKGSRLGKAIFSGEGFVKLGDFVAKSNELRGYIYLADVSRDQVNDSDTYVLSTQDDEPKYKKITRKNTPDRGEIITIADYVPTE